MKELAFSISRRAAVLGALNLMAAGCFGEFAATRSLYRWNTNVSDSKWLRWLVFLVLAILPVYSLFILADALVINTIEFFSDKNPISGGHVDLGHGNTLTSTRTSDPNVIRHEHRKDGKLVRVVYVKRVSEHEMLLLDEHFHVLTRVHLGDHGEIISRDALGRELSSLNVDGVNRVGRALEAGMQPMQAVEAVQTELGREALAARQASESSSAL